jgi:HTH-type transcriptional regulator / antitoxin HipB
MTTKTWAQLKRDRARSADSVAVGYRKARAGYMLAERVRALRVAGGLSQGELAERMGTTQSAISRLEAGGVYPSIDTLEKVGNALHARLVVDFHAVDALAYAKKSPGLAPKVRAIRRSAAGSFLRAEKRTSVSRTTARSTGKRAAKKSAKR